MREAQVDRDLPRFFFGQAVGINSSKRFNEGAFAVIDVTGRRENEMLLCHRPYNSPLATVVAHALRIASTTASSCCGKMVRRSSLKRPFAM